MTDKLKKYETIGCCGIDCGLCPRFYTKGESTCRGCGGLDFNNRHPSCGFLTCCTIKKGWEVYVDCSDFPCRRIKDLDKRYTLKYGESPIQNLNKIKEIGLAQFINIENKKWECSGCGQLLCFHQEVCLNCGNKNEYFPRST